MTIPKRSGLIAATLLFVLAILLLAGRASASEPNDPLFTAHEQWALQNSVNPGDDIGATRAWDVTTGDPSVIVAVVDSGINLADTQDFGGRIWTDAGEIPGNGVDDDGDGLVDDVHGWDYVGNDADPTDTEGHGTAMSGIIGAAGDDGIGMTGVDQDATIMPLRVTQTGSSLDTTYINAAINFAGDHGARIVNLSFAGNASFGGALKSTIESWPNILFVAAAGNNGGTAEYPCALASANILCVAVTDTDDSLASFSNRDNEFNPNAVDIGAPGVHILEPALVGGYQYEQGTSEATAITSGAAALLFSAHPDLTAAQAKQRIMDTVDPDAALVGKTVTGGRLDIGNALDYAPPQTSVSTGPPADGNDATPSFTFTSNETRVTYECQIDGDAFSACASGASFGPLADGPHTFSVRATDGAHNVDTTPATDDFTVDTQAPVTTIDSGSSGTVKSSSAAFTFDATEDARFECSLDDGAWTDCSSGSADYQGLAEGSHTFAVRATDHAGNLDQTPATATWTTDAHAPTTTITSAPAARTNAASVSFAFAADEGSTFECSLDDGAFSSCTSPDEVPSLTEGSHTFAVQATDDSGNIDQTPATATFVIDRTGPAVTLTSTPPASGEATTAVFAFTGETGATFQCSLDDGAFSTCTSAASYAGLVAGSHSFTVRASDDLGNVGAGASYSFTVTPPPVVVPPPPVVVTPEPTPPPVVTPEPTPTPTPATTPTPTPSAKLPDTVLKIKPPHSSHAAKATFRLAGGTTYRYKIDGKAWVNLKTAKLVLALKPGRHVLRVEAVVGAVHDPTPAVYRFRISRR